MPRPEPRRNRYGQYLLPDFFNGQDRGYTRSTTLAKAVDDTELLTRWKLRTALKGVTNRPDLIEVVESTSDKRELDALAEAALTAGGAGARADQGTLLHSLTEQVDDRSLRLDEVDEVYLADVRAYVFALAAAGVEVVPEYIERIVVNTRVNVAGMFDRILRLPDGRLVISDLKTGRNLSFGWGSICCQLAVYAQADGIWNDELQIYEDLPADLDKSVGLIMHCPVGEARCDLYLIDLDAGWEAAQMASQVRAWRSRTGLAELVDPAAMKRAGELYVRLGLAESADVLTTLWSDHRADWTERHTALAAARKQELLAASGIQAS